MSIIIVFFFFFKKKAGTYRAEIFPFDMFHLASPKHVHILESPGNIFQVSEPRLHYWMNKSGIWSRTQTAVIFWSSLDAVSLESYPGSTKGWNGRRMAWELEVLEWPAWLWASLCLCGFSVVLSILRYSRYVNSKMILTWF